MTRKLCGNAENHWKMKSWLTIDQTNMRQPRPERQRGGGSSKQKSSRDGENLKTGCCSENLKVLRVEFNPRKANHGPHAYVMVSKVLIGYVTVRGADRRPKQTKGLREQWSHRGQCLTLKPEAEKGGLVEGHTRRESSQGEKVQR